MKVYNVIAIHEEDIKRGKLPISSNIFANLEDAQDNFNDWWDHLVSNENVIEEEMEEFDKGHAYVKIDNDGEIIQLYLWEQVVL